MDTEVAGQVVIKLSEWATQYLVPWLLRFGAVSDPTDGCECLYLYIADNFRYVFELFA